MAAAPPRWPIKVQLWHRLLSKCNWHSLPTNTHTQSHTRTHKQYFIYTVMAYKMAAVAISPQLFSLLLFLLLVYLPVSSCLISTLLFSHIYVQHFSGRLGRLARPLFCSRCLFIFVITINNIFLRFLLLDCCRTAFCVYVCVHSFAELFYAPVACLWLFDIIWIKNINLAHDSLQVHWTFLIFSLVFDKRKRKEDSEKMKQIYLQICLSK